MKNILLGIDFNDQESYLIEKAVEWAQHFNAKLWILHVADPEPEFVGFGVGPQYIRDAMAQELKKEHKALYDYANDIKEQGIQAEGLLIKGGTTEMILKEAEKLHIDLIIIGHQEHSIFYKMFFGSVASAVVRKSKIPVLLIPV